MSRIGKHIIEVKTSTKVVIAGDVIEVSGPKGVLKQKLHSDVTVELNNNSIAVAPKYETKRARALWGTTRQIIANMVTGVNEGYKKILDINGVGFKAALHGKESLTLILGFSHDIFYIAPDGVYFVSPKPTQVEVHGCDKQLVGQVAAEIRQFRKPEPYKGKGIKYSDEVIRRKEGKKNR